MRTAQLGSLEVSRLGLGAMGMSHAYTGAGSDDDESVRTIHRADEVVLATKYGLVSHTGADAVELTSEQLRRLDDMAPAAGGHHSDAQMQLIER